MASDQILIMATIRLLTAAEGGRHAPLVGPSSYRPNHNFGEAQDLMMCIGSIELAEGERILPGETVQKDLLLFIWPELAPEIVVGREWRIQEGKKLVAIGTVLEVLDLES